MLLLLRGGDELAIRRRLAELKAEADGGSGMLMTNLIAIEGRDATAEAIVAAASTPPFLAPQRIVLVEAFLDRWESRGDQRAPRSVEPFAPLFKAAGGLPPTTMLILTGGAPGRTQNPMVKRLTESGAKDELHAAPEKEALIRFIREEGATRGIRFRTGAAGEPHWDSEEWLRRSVNDPVALLATVTNGNTLMISSELDKLALYTMGREVTVDEVYAVCSGTRDVNDFQLLDAINDGNLGEALTTLAKRWEDLGSGQLLLALLATRYRQLALVADAIEHNATAEEIGRILGPAGRYEGLRNAAIRRAKKLGTGGVRAAFEAIVETDRAHKSGVIRDELTAMEILVASLARLSSRR